MLWRRTTTRALTVAQGDEESIIVVMGLGQTNDYLIYWAEPHLLSVGGNSY